MLARSSTFTLIYNELLSYWKGGYGGITRIPTGFPFIRTALSSGWLVASAFRRMDIVTIGCRKLETGGTLEHDNEYMLGTLQI